MERGACSTRKIAIPNETGTASRIAIRDDTIVPHMNGNAPNASCAGAHSEAVKNPSPNRVIVGIELRAIINTIAATSTRMLEAAANRMKR